MDEQTEAEVIQNRSVNEVSIDEIEERTLSQDSDGDGLTDHQEALLGTDPDNADTDRDGVSNLQETLLGTDPNNPEPARDDVSLDTNRQQPPIVSDLYQWTQQQSSVDANQAQGSNPEAGQPPIVNDLYQWSQQRSDLNANQAQALDALNESSSEAGQPAVINDIYQRLLERTNLNIEQVTLAVYQGSELLYLGNSQSVEFDTLSPQIQDLLRKTLEDPTGLQGELAVSVNGQLVLQVQNGNLTLDEYGLTGNQQVSQTQSTTQSISSEPQFDPVATHERYSQEVNGNSQSTTDIAPIDAFEHIAQTALDDGLSSEQTQQVLKQDPFYQSFALGLGKDQADRYSTSLVNSLIDKGKTQNELSSLKHSGKNLEAPSSDNNRTNVLEDRIKSLEVFNQQLSSQLDIVNQKLDKLSQSKAFQSQSPGLNQFFGKVSQSITNTLQATKNALRQKAGEVSLSLIDVTTRKSIQWFGEETKDGLRVIDSTKNDKRIGVNRQGDLWLSKSPDLQASSQYQRLSHEIDKSLPPSLQLKQVAQAALKEQLTTAQIQSVLSQSPKFQEISSKQGVDKANQFASVAIAAAQRQNLIDARPKQQEQQKQKQTQA